MFIPSNQEVNWESKSNKELWSSFRENDRKALSALFLRFYERLFRYGMNFSSNEDLARDGIQKLFLQLWKNRKTLSCPESVESYLCVSLRRILLRRKKQEGARGKRNMTFIEEELNDIFSIEELTIIKEEKKKRREIFRKSLQKLTPRQKEALLLRVDNGMSNGEISEIMEISDKRVRNLIYEATNRLKNEIHKLTGLVKD